jgi:NADPH:quinone reductase-like Zn-dependent oxidoreductase
MSRIVRFHRIGGPEARTFPLRDIVEAHRYLESNQQVGKIVVTT